MSFEGRVEAASEQPIAAGLPRTGISFAWAIPALLALAAIVQQSMIGLDTDVSWLITVGEKVLDGQRLYIDIFEVNPPASVLIYLAGNRPRLEHWASPPSSPRLRWSLSSPGYPSGCLVGSARSAGLLGVEQGLPAFARRCWLSCCFPAPALPSASMWPS